MQTKKVATQLFSEGVRYTNLKTYISKLKKAEREEYLENQKELSDLLWDLEKAEYARLEKIEKEKEAKKLKLSYKTFLALKEKADAIAACFEAGYSMGGVVDVYAKNKYGNVIGKKDNREEYAKSSKFSANHSLHIIKITISELKKIEIVGGIPTIRLENAKISKCIYWIGEGKKQNYTIEKKEGYITSTYHADTYEECVEWRKKEAARKMQDRIGMDKWLEKVKTRFVGFQHSIQAGNCKVGTENFIQRHKLNKSFGYRLDYILELENTEFTKKLARVL